jgi:hypothetical protein
MAPTSAAPEQAKISVGPAVQRFSFESLIISSLDVPVLKRHLIVSRKDHFASVSFCIWQSNRIKTACEVAIPFVLTERETENIVVF